VSFFRKKRLLFGVIFSRKTKRNDYPYQPYFGMICHHPHEISVHLFFTLMLKSLNILGLYFVGKLADYEELVEGGKPDVSVEDANRVLNVEDDMDTQQSRHPAIAAAVPTPSPAVCTSTAAIASTASSGAAIWGGEITVTSDRNALCHQA
jgi:hypothetical protein